MKKIPKEAVETAIRVLMQTSGLHLRSCLEDNGGIPDFECLCPIRDIIKKIKELQ